MQLGKSYTDFWGGVFKERVKKTMRCGEIWILKENIIMVYCLLLNIIRGINYELKHSFQIELMVHNCVILSSYQDNLVTTRTEGWRPQNTNNKMLVSVSLWSIVKCMISCKLFTHNSKRWSRTCNPSFIEEEMETERLWNCSMFCNLQEMAELGWLLYGGLWFYLYINIYVLLKINNYILNKILIQIKAAHKMTF